MENLVYLSMDTTHRIPEKGILKWLNRRKVIVITGARQVGKTTMLKKMFPNNGNTLWLNADETSIRERFDKKDLHVLEQIIGDYQTIILDEVQRIKDPGILLKLLADNYPDRQFIATGSSALEISDQVFEPLTGRQILIHLYPFTLAELYPHKSDFEIEKELDFHLIFGSYPEICNNRIDAEVLLKNLSNQYLYKDVLSWKDIRKPELLDKLLRLLAFQIGSEVSVHELSKQLQVKSETVENYIDLLEKSYVVFRLKSYSNNSRKEISKMSKIYFWDNGIRNAIINQFNPLSLRNDAGALWENFIIAERMKMNAFLGNNTRTFFWRNYNQSEVDYLEVDNDTIHAFEMKWNTIKKNAVSKAFTNLYPLAKTDTITPRHFTEFVKIKSVHQ